jgi:hypothetical protein
MIERRGIELCEHKDLYHIRVDAVADGNIDKAILSAKRHGWLGSLFGEREEPGTLTTAENDSEHVSHTNSSITIGSGELY